MQILSGRHNVVLSDAEVYTVKTAVNLKNGALSYESYATEHTVVDGTGKRHVTCTDAKGIGISAAPQWSITPTIQAPTPSTRWISGATRG